MDTKPLKGLRSHYPTDKGPIDTYQLGHDGRIEYLAAEIGIEHLKRGCNTTDEWKKWASERGNPSDEPGLIISKRLGGSGVDAVNLFPKSPSLDKTSWGEHEEKAYNEAAEMKKWKKIKFFAKFEYPEATSLRPSVIEYQYELPSGTVLHTKVTNEKAEAAVEEVAEDEDEYEYEYEEESEEEAEEVAAADKATSEDPQSPEKSPSPMPTLEEEPQPTVTVASTTTPKVDAYQDEPMRPTTPPSPPVSYTYKPPPPAASETFRREEYPEPRSQSPSPQKQKSPSPKAADKGTETKLFTQSDFIEMLPIIGSLKLALDTLRALFNRNVNLAFWKGIQCGISLLGDFNFMRAFARHGKLLVKPITEQKLVGFANKAEPQLILFGACKAGNQVLSSLKRMLT